MAISTVDGFVAALAAAQHLRYMKVPGTLTANAFSSLWTSAGMPGAGSTPAVFSAGSGYAPTDATAGAMPFTNPGGGSTTYVARVSAGSMPTSSTVNAGTLVLYHRLWHCSGFALNTTSAQNITTPGTAHATGAGVEVWGEVYTAGGATPATFTVSYTDQDGNTGASATYSYLGTEIAGRMVPFSLASGDSGVRAVASLTLSISTGGAGDFGLTVLQRLVEIPLASSSGEVFGAHKTGLPQVADDACLAWMMMSATTGAADVHAIVSLAQG